MSNLTPQQRSLRARIAAMSRIASPTYNAAQATGPATAAYWSRYYAEVDPDGSLSPEERERKAKAAWSRDMARARFEASKRRRR